jgi:hypothetical protein
MGDSSTLDTVCLLEAQRAEAGGVPGVVDVVVRSAELERQAKGPRVIASLAAPDQVAWLLLSRTQRAAAEADSLARAFVWPSYARPSASVPAGVPGALIEAITAAGYERPLVLSSESSSPACCQALSLMLDVLSNRPPEGSTVTRHISRVLRDLDDALARQDPVAASDLIEEARATGRLSVSNESALRVRIETARGAWAAGIEHAVAARLPERRLAVHVQHDLLACLYHEHLADLLGTDDERLVEVVRDDVLPTFGTVFDSPNVARSLPARTAWVARIAAAPGAYAGEVLDAVLEGATDDERVALKGLIDLVRTSPNEASVTAKSLLSDDEPAAALEVAVRAHDIADGERIEVISFAAAALGDVGMAAARVQDALERSAGGLEVVENLNADVSGWLPFLRRLLDEPVWPDAARILESRSRSWPVTVPDPFDPREAGELLELVVGESPAARDALPRLILAITDAVESDEQAAQMVPLFLSTTRAISEQEACGLSDMSMMADALAGALRGGVSATQYAELCEGVVDAWSAIGAPPKYARYVVDATATLLEEPSRDTEIRDRTIGELVSSLAADAARPMPRVPRDVWIELSELLAGHGLDGLVPAAAQELASGTDQASADEFGHLAGAKILVHSLQPGVPERVRTELAARVPSAMVVVDDSKVAGDALREHIRNADVILLAHRACKHAVSNFIKAERGPDSQLRYATGKGWSSILDAARLTPRLG